MNVIAFPGRELAPSTPSSASVAVARLVDYGFGDNPLAPSPLLVDPRPLLEAVADLGFDESVSFIFERGRRWTFAVHFESSRADAGEALTTLLHASAPSARFKPDEGAFAQSAFTRTLTPRGETLAAFTRSTGQEQSITMPAAPASPSDLGVTLRLADEVGVSRIRIAMRPRPLEQTSQFLISAALNRSQWQIAWPGSRRADLHKQLDAWMSGRVGVAFEVDASGDRPINTAAAQALSIAMFGVSLASDPPGELDLRLACARATLPHWRFWPQASDFRSTRRAHVEAPMAQGSVVLGHDGGDEAVALHSLDRTRHFYVVGGTGTGKTTLLDGIMRQDIESGEGVLLIDPHGDLAASVLKSVPASRANDVVWVQPSDLENTWRLDLLNCRTSDEGERDRLANQLLWFLRNLYQNTPEAFGPVFELYLRNALFLLMLAEKPEDRSLLKIEDVFMDESFRQRLARQCSDKKVAQFWISCADETTGEQSLSNVAPYIVSKFTQLTGSPQARRFLGGNGPRIDFREAMDAGKIVIISLPKGELGEYATRFLGALCLMDLSSAALSRCKVPAEERRHFRCFIDEFQNLATRSASDMMAECRKYNLSLTLANQSLSQIGGDRFTADVANATLANCGSVAAFRVGPFDAAALTPLFGASAVELTTLATGEFLVRRLSNGEPQPIQRLLGVLHAGRSD